MKSFEDLLVWQKAKTVFEILYSNFSKSKDYYLKDQILRAGLSISNTIAEGYERQTTKEFRQFLFIAKGRCGEIRSMILIAKSLKLIDDQMAKGLLDKLLEISKMLSGLIKSLKV